SRILPTAHARLAVVRAKTHMAPTTNLQVGGKICSWLPLDAFLIQPREHVVAIVGRLELLIRVTVVDAIERLFAQKRGRVEHLDASELEAFPIEQAGRVVRLLP